MKEVAKVSHDICPYNDKSGFHYAVTVKRERKNTEDGETDTVSILIAQGSDIVVIDCDHWEDVRDAVTRALNFVLNNT